MEHSSLEYLNDDCLINIFKLLEIRDFVNLARTCTRLLQLADTMSENGFSDIRIMFLNKHGSIQEFSEMLKVIGKNILSIQVERVRHEESLIFKTIREQCKNLTSMTLRMFEKPIHLEDFRNLKELKLFQVKMTSNDLKKYFTINSNIDSIAWDFYDNEFMELLTMLPKLKSLSLLSYMYPVELHHHLLHLVGLTKLAFMSTGNCNNLLMEISKRFNLVELNVRCYVNETTYHIINSFKNLESLSTDIPCFIKYVTYPPKLKRIEFTNMDIPCSTLLLLVTRLKVLKEFYLINGAIYWDLDDSNMYYGTSGECGYQTNDPSSVALYRRRNYPDGSEMFYRIAEKLKEVWGQRNLKIIYCNTTGKEGNKCIYSSDHLKVVLSSSLLQAPAVFYSVRN